MIEMLADGKVTLDYCHRNSFYPYVEADWVMEEV
jgi:hypothetical protein